MKIAIPKETKISDIPKILEGGQFHLSGGADGSLWLEEQAPEYGAEDILKIRWLK